MSRIVTVLALLLAPLTQAEAQVLARMSNPKVEVTMTHPPGFPLTLDRAAVVPRGGNCSEEFADMVIELFASRGVDLVDRQNIEAILAEQDLGSSGYVDVQTAAELGKILGSTALVLVNTLRCDEVQNRSQKSFRTLDGKQGVQHIAKTEGFFKASVRVVDLATARIFAARTVEGRSVLENSSYDGRPEFPSPYDARDRSLRDARSEIHRMFFPWDERRQLYFFNSNECNLKAAFRLLQIGDIKEAAALSAENLEACKSTGAKPKFLARAYYNLGMTRFLQSEYDEALDLLGQAYRIEGGNIIAESISECRRARDLAQKMAQLEESVAIDSAKIQEPLGTATSGAGALADRLQELDGLLEKELISREEYDRKRKEILSEI